MEKKTNLTATESNLLETRKEALNQAMSESIRPHGKLWGMDVFSWSNPEIHLIAPTIHAFPFPVVLVAPSSLAMSIMDYDSSLKPNIHAVLAYNDKLHAFNLTIFKPIATVIIADSVAETLDELENCKLNRGVVLFCSEGAEFEHDKKKFFDFLAINQL
ncbi:MAG: hypothetical protein M9916_01340 [Crocinitomicaceae bacterium]|nr:hypothetical protein [Crocinitomicaceae bacterium]